MADAVDPPVLEIEDLRAAPTDGGDDILNGVTLTVRPGEVHAVMGPNGSGKSTLANVLLGSPEYEVTGGSIRFMGDDIADWGPDDRGAAGMFLAFQYPQAIPGVSVLNFLRQALSARKGIDLSMLELRVSIMEWMDRLGIDPSFSDRHLNDGFSGGEIKRSELLQLLAQDPDFVLLDEPESGVDLVNIAVIGDLINRLLQKDVRIRERNHSGLVITHTGHILDYVSARTGYVMINGRLSCGGDPHEILMTIKQYGYEECSRCVR